MKKTTLASSLVLALLASLAPAGDEGFQSLFDGKTLNGWHTSAQTGHSATSRHKTAGRWVVEDGAIPGLDLPALIHAHSHAAASLLQP